MTTPAQAGILTVPWVEGLRSLSGYDNSGAKPRAMGDGFDISLGAPDFVGDATSLTGTTNIQWVQSVEQLSSALRVNGSASAAYKIFSGGLAADFVRNVSMNTYSIYLLVHAVYETNVMRCDNKMADLPADRLTMDASEFRGKYGDYFVVGKKMGGERVAVLELTANSSETKDKLITATQFDVKSPVVSVTSNLSTGISNALALAGVSMTLHIKEEGVGPDPLGLAATQGLKKMNKPEDKKKASTPKAVSKATNNEPKAKKATEKVEDEGTGAKKNDGTDETAKNKKPLEAPKVETNDEFIDDAEVDSYEADLNSQLVSKLIASVDNMKNEVARHGVNRAALVKPYAQLARSPLDSVIFTPDGKGDLYQRMETSYERAKFIRDTADFAVEALDKGMSPGDFSLDKAEMTALSKRMQRIMDTVVKLDHQVRAGTLTVDEASDQVPEKEDLSQLPQRYRPATLTSCPAPLITDPEAVMLDMMSKEAALKAVNTKFSGMLFSTAQDNAVRVKATIDQIKLGVDALRLNTTAASSVTPFLIQAVEVNRRAVSQSAKNLRDSFNRLLRISDEDTLAPLRFVMDRILGDGNPSTALYTQSATSDRKVGEAILDIWVALGEVTRNLDLAVKALPPTKDFKDVVRYNSPEWDNIANLYQAAAVAWTPSGN